jgi:hypothetical protein
MLSFPRSIIPTATQLIVDVKKETKIVSKTCGSIRIIFLNRGNQETGFEVLTAVTIFLNVTQCCHEEHAKQ